MKSYDFARVRKPTQTNRGDNMQVSATRRKRQFEKALKLVGKPYTKHHTICMNSNLDPVPCGTTRSEQSFGLAKCISWHKGCQYGPQGAH